MRRRELFGETIHLSLSSSSGTAGGANNSSVTFTVYNNSVPLTKTGVTVSSSQSFATPSFNSGTGVVTVTVTENPSLTSTRSAVISVGYKENYVNYNLTQNASTWDLSPSSKSIYSNAQSYTFTVRRNGSAITSGGISASSNQSWATVSTNTGTGVVTVTCTENTLDNNRSASITVTYSGQSKTHSLTQKQLILEVYPSDGYVSASGGSTTFYVYRNDDRITTGFTVSSNKSWVTVNVDEYGSVNTTSSFNDETVASSRTASITVTFGGKSAIYTLEQDASSWQIVKSTSDATPLTSYDVGTPVGASRYGEILLNGTNIYSGTNYTLTTSDSWITATKSSSSGFRIAVSTFYDENPRNGTVTVNFLGQTKTIQVSQQGTGGTLSVRSINGNSYYFSNWPSDATTVIGIEIPNSNLCITRLNPYVEYPDTGGFVQSCRYGGSGYDTQGLPNFTTSGAAITDMDGKANTAAILAVDNSNSTAWQTASTIASEGTNQYVHPFAQLCWRYSNTGANKGDAYIPSAGQLYTYFRPYLNEIYKTRLTLHAKYGINGGEPASLISST